MFSTPTAMVVANVMMLLWVIDVYRQKPPKSTDFFIRMPERIKQSYNYTLRSYVPYVLMWMLWLDLLVLFPVRRLVMTGMMIIVLLFHLINSRRKKTGLATSPKTDTDSDFDHKVNDKGWVKLSAMLVMFALAVSTSYFVSMYSVMRYMRIIPLLMWGGSIQYAQVMRLNKVLIAAVALASVACILANVVLR